MRTYAVFIDLVKAFDTVNRRLLWARFRSFGICGKLFWALKTGYSGCTLQGKMAGYLSSIFKDVGLGVRQGDVDSSDGFALFVDDLDAEIAKAETKLGRKLGIPLIGNNDAARGDRIPVLKHADDTVILATCEEDAQALLEAVEKWCQKWQISPNPDKCVVIVFDKKVHSPKLCLLGKILKVVDETVYLGYLLHRLGSWAPHVVRRVDKARNWDRIASAILGHAGGATAAVAAEVRDASAEVGALYGGEMWGTLSPSESGRYVDQAQAAVGKAILHVRSTAEAEGVLSELGWTASSVKAWKHRLTLWWRLGRTKSALLNTIEWQAEKQSSQLCSDYNWWSGTHRELVKLTELTGSPPEKLRGLKKRQFQCILNGAAFKHEKHIRLLAMKTSSRLSSLADELETKILRSSAKSWKELQAGYLPYVSSKYHIRLLAMTRLGLLPIEVETGRWHNIAKHERWCNLCKNILGCTHHFLRECDKLKSSAVPHWSAAPKRNDSQAGIWWRTVAQNLEKRWREKRQLQTSVSQT